MFALRERRVHVTQEDFEMAVCTEAGMFALRERRVHVTQEDFEMAVAKVMKKETEKNMSLRKLWK
uniref:AAA ATPase AAA+ lid domain-containing protein n=1 Tax=Glycine max TaxID=3847 RepID=A0A0R0HS78_SOYBN